MYRHFLIATDGSELAEKAVTQGLALAEALGARVTAVTVSEPLTALMVGEAVTFMAGYEEAAASNAARILSVVRTAAAQRGVACETAHVKGQFPAEGIIEAAKDRGCDLIVMASHGRRGLAKLLLGSQATRVLSDSPIPVLVCR